MRPSSPLGAHNPRPSPLIRAFPRAIVRRERLTLLKAGQNTP